MDKEGLTEVILVFWVAVTFRWCGFDEQLHRLDLVLSTNEAPRHWTAVSGGLWQLDVILKCEVKQRGQREDIHT